MSDKMPELLSEAIELGLQGIEQVGVLDHLVDFELVSRAKAALQAVRAQFAAMQAHADEAEAFEIALSGGRPADNVREGRVLISGSAGSA